MEFFETLKTFNFNDAYDELNKLYADGSGQSMLLEKKHKKDNGGKSDDGSG